MKFQIERIALFSDAVFAIAITLMIIEVKPPHLEHHASFGEVMSTLAHMSPSFAGIILSFVFIGMFWIRHHQLMQYMAAYNTTLLMRNLFFLLAIVFLPFSTAFVFHNFESLSPVPLIFYNLNYIAASLLSYYLLSYVVDPANGLCIPEIKEDMQTMKKEFLFPVAVYLLVIGLSFWNPSLASIGYGAFALERVVIRKKEK